mmetsp:Transcript_55260/g.121189  ORF Transcript_55260/g.121189 Transcript_55260/m.121189 type:complete len:109 (-) Transcript_55260:608-934(-)
MVCCGSALSSASGGGGVSLDQSACHATGRDGGRSDPPTEHEGGSQGSLGGEHDVGDRQAVALSDLRRGLDFCPATQAPPCRRPPLAESTEPAVSERSSSPPSSDSGGE